MSRHRRQASSHRLDEILRHLESFAADAAFHQFVRVASDDIAIRCHATVHEGCAQSPAGFDDQRVVRTARRVPGKGHAGYLSGHHQLHDHRHSRRRGESNALPIALGLPAPQREPAVDHALFQFGLIDVVVGCVLAGKTHGRTIFAEGAAAHGANRAASVDEGEFGEGRVNGARQFRVQCRRTQTRQRGIVGGSGATGGQSEAVEMRDERLRRDDEPHRDVVLLAQRAQRRRFAADLINAEVGRRSETCDVTQRHGSK